jgi:hypothetical protein
LEKLKAILGEQYEIYTGNQKNRDLGKYHITVINVMDYNSLINRLGIDTFVNSLEAVFDFEIDDVKLIGIGKAEKAGNTAYFVVIRSEKLDAIRNKYELPEQDFHITIGFKYKDVFGVRKNEVIKDTDGFLDILSHIYFKNHESFDFIKEGCGTFQFSTSVFDKNMESSMTVIGENGSFKIGGQYMNEVEYCHIKDYTMPELAPTNPGNDYGAYKGSAQNHNYVIANVVDVLKGRDSITTNALEGLKVVDIIERIYNVQG